MRQKRSIGEYLAFLSVKYEVDPEEFLNALRLAREQKKLNCGKLSIEFRGNINAQQIFLIRNNSGIVAQFRVSDDFLLEKENTLRKFIDTTMLRKVLFQKCKGTQSHTIRDLRAGMNHVNLKAKILEVAEPRRVVTRYGNYANIAKALIADETGTIKLCLWNEQINAVSVGDTVQIGNARTSTFRGEKQLTLGTKGELSNAADLESNEVACLPSALKT